MPRKLQFGQQHGELAWLEERLLRDLPESIYHAFEQLVEKTKFDGSDFSEREMGGSTSCSRPIQPVVEKQSEGASVGRDEEVALLARLTCLALQARMRDLEQASDAFRLAAHLAAKLGNSSIADAAQTPSKEDGSMLSSVALCSQLGLCETLLQLLCSCCKSSSSNNNNNDGNSNRHSNGSDQQNVVATLQEVQHTLELAWRPTTDQSSVAVLGVCIMQTLIAGRAGCFEIALDSLKACEASLSKVGLPVSQSCWLSEQLAACYLRSGNWREALARSEGAMALQRELAGVSGAQGVANTTPIRLALRSACVGANVAAAGDEGAWVIATSSSMLAASSLVHRLLQTGAPGIGQEVLEACRELRVNGLLEACEKALDMALSTNGSDSPVKDCRLELLCEKLILKLLLLEKEALDDPSYDSLQMLPGRFMRVVGDFQEELPTSALCRIAHSCIWSIAARVWTLKRHMDIKQRLGIAAAWLSLLTNGSTCVGMAQKGEEPTAAAAAAAAAAAQRALVICHLLRGEKGHAQEGAASLGNHRPDKLTSTSSSSSSNLEGPVAAAYPEQQQQQQQQQEEAAEEEEDDTIKNYCLQQLLLPPLVRGAPKAAASSSLLGDDDGSPCPVLGRGLVASLERGNAQWISKWVLIALKKATYDVQQIFQPSATDEQPSSPSEGFTNSTTRSVQEAIWCLDNLVDVVLAIVGRASVKTAVAFDKASNASDGFSTGSSDKHINDCLEMLGKLQTYLTIVGRTLADLLRVCSSSSKKKNENEDVEHQEADESLLSALLWKVLKALERLGPFLGSHRRRSVFELHWNFGLELGRKELWEHAAHCFGQAAFMDKAPPAEAGAGGQPANNDNNASTEQSGFISEKGVKDAAEEATKQPRPSEQGQGTAATSTREATAKASTTPPEAPNNHTDPDPGQGQQQAANEHSRTNQNTSPRTPDISEEEQLEMMSAVACMAASLERARGASAAEESEVADAWYKRVLKIGEDIKRGSHAFTEGEGKTELQQQQQQQQQQQHQQQQHQSRAAPLILLMEFEARVALNQENLAKMVYQAATTMTLPVKCFLTMAKLAIQAKRSHDAGSECLRWYLRLLAQVAAQGPGENLQKFAVALRELVHLHLSRNDCWGCFEEVVGLLKSFPWIASCYPKSELEWLCAVAWGNCQHSLKVGDISWALRWVTAAVDLVGHCPAFEASKEKMERIAQLCRESSSGSSSQQ